MASIEVVITGIGVVCPLGIGREPVWEAFRQGRSGVGPLDRFDSSALPVRIAGLVRGFDPKALGVPRKNVKVMAPDAQFGVAASVLARKDAGIGPETVDPERLGIVLGADRICGPLENSEAPYRRCIVDGQFRFDRWAPEGMPVTFPLAFLMVLPNMIASHISIVQDAQGPNNTIHHGEVSSLLALIEAVRVIERGAADVMLAGGASSQMNPYDWSRHCVLGRVSRRQGDPTTVSRPFDRLRDGEVRGEGAAVFVLERREHAEARGANILGRVLGWGSAFDGTPLPQPGGAIRRAVVTAMEDARLSPTDLGHINAHAMSMVKDDALEAQALSSVLPETPVTAPTSYFGNLGAAAGAVEMVGSMLALAQGCVPQTLNYEYPDAQCPVRVIHGEPLATTRRTALLLNWNEIGQAVALVVAGPD